MYTAKYQLVSKKEQNRSGGICKPEETRVRVHVRVRVVHALWSKEEEWAFVP